MGLLSIAAKAAAIGMKVAGDVKKPVTIYANLTAQNYDTETNATTPTWGTTKTVLGLIYKATEKKPDAAPETVQQTLLVQGADFDGVPINQEAEVDAPGVDWTTFPIPPEQMLRWNVWRVTSDPARAVIILDLYR